MLYDFTFEDKIMREKSLKDDYVLFSVLFTSILSNTHDIGLTNGKSLVIGRTNKDYMAWLWTADDITTVEYNELMTYIPSLFENETEFTFMAKPNVADDIASLLGGNITKIGGLINYRCDNVVSQSPKGIMRNPKTEDQTRIAEFLRQFEIECFDRDEKIDKYMDRANNFINHEYCYILEVDGITAAMVSMKQQDDNYFRIAPVFTATEYRNKGYAAYLVSELCKKAQELGKTPILYADEFNPASNKTYRNIGFTECGRLKEIRMVRQ
jgi:Predicted acetyltransferase